MIEDEKKAIAKLKTVADLDASVKRDVMEDNNEKKQSPIAAALVAACAEMKQPRLSGENKHYHNRYATLDDCLTVAKAAFAKHDLALMQYVRHDPPQPAMCITRILHADGSAMQDAGIPLLVPDNPTPQTYGSALTYSRRYGLCTFLGLTGEPDDDDAEAAMGRQKPAPKPTTAPPKAKTEAKAAKVVEKYRKKAAEPEPPPEVVTQSDKAWKQFSDSALDTIPKLKTVSDMQVWLHTHRAELSAMRTHSAELFKGLESVFELELEKRKGTK